MRALLVGSGAVGDAIAVISSRRGFLEGMVVADRDLLRAQRAVQRAGAPGGFEAATLDATDPAAVTDMARRHRVDIVVNACDPRCNPSLLAGARAAGANYLDMAMTLSRPHPDRPYEELGVVLGSEEFAQHDAWVDAGLLAVVGMGVEPGLSDVLARYASDELFSSIDEIGVRDGSNLVVDGYGFAPTFSIWTTIEECLNPPLVWERSRGLYTTEPFSEPEIFVFPEGIGAVECVNVEHEEVLLIPRWVPCERVTFKYGLGTDVINVLRTMHRLGLDSTEPVRVGDVEVAPRDVVAALLPNPALMGPQMHGVTCAGTWVTGLGKDGRPREVYLYHAVDNDACMAEYGCQAVAWQTAVNPVVAMELLASGAWSGVGVLGPEAFEPGPFLDLLAAYGSPHRMEEREAGRAPRR